MDKWRRVIVPGILCGGAYLVALAAWLFEGALRRGFLDSLRFGEVGFPVFLLVPPLFWLVFPAVFIAVYLCGVRGGSRGECIGVGMAPLILAAVYAALTQGRQAARLVWRALVWDYPSTDMVLGDLIRLSETLRGLLSEAATCAAAIWLCFFVARHLREPPHWVAAEQKRDSYSANGEVPM